MNNKSKTTKQQYVTEVKVKSVPKAGLVQKKFQFREDFNFSAAIHIPVANINKGAPEISVTISAGYNKLTLKSKNSMEEIKDGLIDLVVYLRDNEEHFNKILIEEQEAYYKAQQEERNKMRDNNVVPLKKAQ